MQPILYERTSLTVNHVVYVLGTAGAGKTDFLNNLELYSDDQIRCRPCKVSATSGQEIHMLRVCPPSSTDCVDIEVRELGGSAAASWESFIRDRTLKDFQQSTQYSLIYIVDAASPHQLCMASNIFHLLKHGPSGICCSWPTLVVIQKCASPYAFTKDEVSEYLLVEHLAVGIQVIEADSWNGYGIGDIFDWILRCIQTG
ncbi:unnamed protein product [Phytomonas sp. EM1]|nr:unnamed protein product [Phytomonas sp. EM1]|eukprot:CCW64036.1 unnamed protein product [Phytomonas sp. isolate EM1]